MHSNHKSIVTGTREEALAQPTDMSTHYSTTYPLFLEATFSSDMVVVRMILRMPM
jgi:hypothetical protein